MQKTKFLLFILSLFPVFWLMYGLLTNQLGANPVEEMTRSTGLWALRFLWITLLVTPLRWLTGWNSLVKIRRMMGLYVFFYASLHLLLYLGLDQSFDFAEVIRDIIKRPFITVGIFTYLTLIPLVITSNRKMLQYLGGNRWKKIHQLVYLIAIASSIHFYMLVKLDKSEPVFYILLLVLLLLFRILHRFQIKLSFSHK